MVAGCCNHRITANASSTYLTPWHTLAASLWAATTCGYLYTFSTFSGALKSMFKLSEAELNTIGMGQVIVGLITFSTGVLVDRFGVTISLVIGALLNSTAWLVFGSVIAIY